MKLIGLLNGLEYTVLKGDLTINVKNIVNDSKQVVDGSLFVCIDGFKLDGHSFIEEAIQKGARALLVEKDVQIPADVTVVRVKDSREALAYIASKYYNSPSENFDLIGVTGTNGKTSIVFLIKNILEYYNKKTGIIGTIENRIGDQVLVAARTTPDSVELQKLFSEMVESNVSKVIMEVSSHALDLHRVDGCRFDIGVFTNLTHDHLEYHKTMENYRDAKLKLFKMCPIGVINLDDPAGDYMIANGSCKIYMTYGCNNDQVLLNAYQINNQISGTTFKLLVEGQEHLFEIQTPGRFSVYNALAAIGVCLALHVPIEIIKKALQEKSTIKGRFQTIMSPKGYYVVVDYAHTPDGLVNVLNTIKDVAIGKIITVFGCGGDRDQSKRAPMGKIVGEKSDYAIITSDNPRTEDPEAIVQQIEAGVKPTNCTYEIEVDRKKAIYKALSLAQKDDVVLIAGKGHEDYQILGNVKFHFDDVEEVNAFITQENP